MSRFQRLCIVVLIALTAWLLACAGVGQQGSHALARFVYSLPLLAVLLYGLMASLLLVHGVATFKSVPEEAAMLRLEITEAQSYLRKQGVAIS
jgi:succinate dehydrogenase hydrophobic anchor subunit